MGLFELCLISLLSPQEPGAVPPHDIAANAAPVTTTAVPQDPPVQLLQAAEAKGAEADPKVLLALTTGEDAAIAERAAWLLGHTDNKEHKARLPEVLKTSPHANARVLAMQTIRQLADVTGTPLALHALNDEDRRVRTLAAQLLGRLKRPATIEPLLGLIHTSSMTDGNEPATDVQAAILALADIGATEHLLRMATTVNDGKATGAGESLAYAFQTLSPKLEGDEEATILMAVLDHKETLVRRYAITRLTERNDHGALAALEGRLGSEGDELRPLIEVAIAQLRNDNGPAPDGEMEQAKANAQVLWARITKWWNGLETVEQGIAAGIPALLLVALMLMRRASRRRAHDEEAQAAAAWVQPSDEYVEGQEEEFYDEYGEEEGFEDEDGFDGEFEGEFEEGFDENPEDDQPQFDTSGWEDEEAQEATVGEGANPEDELFR